MSNINLTTLLNIKDYYLFFFYTTIITRIWTILSFNISLLGVFFFLTIKNNNELSVSMVIIPISACLAGSIIYFIINLISLYLIAKKEISTNNIIKYENKYIISEEGIITKSQIGENKITWNDIFKVKKTKHAYYLFISKYTAIIIPLRFFVDETMIINFNKLLDRIL